MRKNWIHSISLGLFPLSKNDSDSDIAKNGCRIHLLAMSLSLCENGALRLDAIEQRQT